MCNKIFNWKKFQQGENKLNPLDFLGIPDIIGWTIMAMLIFFSGTILYQKFSHKFSKQCRNCGKYSGGKIICDKCYDGIKDILPNGWSNKKWNCKN